MKKRILSVLLVIALLVTVGIIAAQAEDTAPTPAEIVAAANEMSFPYAAEGEEATNQTGVCPICGTSQTFLPVPTDSSNWNAGGTKHYYGWAEEIDIGTTRIYNAGGTIHVFLNGSKITTANTSNGITSGGNLAIFGDGEVYQAAEGVKLFYPRTAGYTAIYGGTYSANGGRVVDVWGVYKADFYNFEMYGGTLEGNASSEAPLFIGMGGCALVEGGVINADSTVGVAISIASNNATESRIENVTIGGTADINGSVVQSTYGNLTITGNATVDEVTSATSYAGTLNVSGGEIGTLTFGSKNSTLTVSDGTIDTLSATAGTFGVSGGDITTATVSGITMSLSGDPVIDTLDLTAATLPIAVADMAEGADVTVNVATGTAFTDGDDADYIDYFDVATTDPLYKLTTDENGALIYAAKTFDTAEEIVDYANNYMSFEKGLANDTTVSAFCPICNKSVTWRARTSGGNLNAGGDKHLFFTAESLTVTGKIYTGSGATHLFLNDVTINATHDSGVFYSDSTDDSYGDIGFSILGNATVTQNGTGSLFFANGTGNLNVYGGTYTGDWIFRGVEAETSGIDVYGGTMNGDSEYTAGVLNLYGGTVNGDITIGGGTLNVEDATVSGTVTNNGAAAAVKNATVTSITANGGTVALNAGAKITNLTVASGQTVTIDGMATDAKINLTATGAFTDGGDADYVNCFVLTDSKYKVSADDAGVLSVTEKSFEDPAEIVDYANNYMSFDKGLENDATVSAFCPICNANVTWRARTGGGNVNPGGNKHLFLTSETYNLTSKIYTGSGATHIFLNGATINANHDSGVFYSDTSNTAYGDGGISLLGNGTVNQTGTGYALFANGGILNVYGGTYTGEKIFHSESDASVINVYGGTFNGDSLFNKGTLNLKGGKVNGTIQLSDPSIEIVHSGAVTFNTDIDVALDLNGHSEVTIGGTGEVTVSDSKNQSTLSSYGTATITNPNVVAADNFVALTEDDSTVGYHYYEAALKGVALKAPAEGEKVGLYYKGAWSMDSVLKEAADIGVVVSLTKKPTATFYSEYEEALANGTAHQNFFYSYAGTSVVNGAAKTSVLVDGILKTSREADANDTAGQTKIYAAAYIHLPEQDIMIVSDPRTDGLDELSVYDVLAKIQVKDGAESLTEFYTKWNQYSNVESIVATLIAG